MPKIHFDANLKFLKGCVHGPQTWPWWRWVSFSFVKVDNLKSATGYRLWIYFRRLGAVYFDIYFYRRGLK